MGKMNSIGLILLLCMTTLNAMIGMVPQNASGFLGGDGSLGDPYQVADVYDLQNISLDPCAHYILLNDIDAQETQTWNWNGTVFLGFNPIGNDTSIFEGKFDGNGYEIYDLYINRPTDDRVGLFGYLGTESSVRNVGLKNCNVTGYDNTGALAGRNSGSIAVCHSSGAVSGHSNVGGMVGYNYGSGDLAASITECYSNASVNASGFYIGGFAGYNYWGGTIESCFSTGTVKGVQSIGGFVGVNEGNIEMCYSTGPVSGSTTGGFAGMRSAWISNSFWDIDTSGQTQGTGWGSSAGIAGKSTEEMMRESTFTTAKWDFHTIWILAEGSTRPYLRVFGGDGTQDYPYIVTDVFELQDINSNLSAHYVLGCDIDAAATGAWDSGAGFLPLGNFTQPFTGKFHGNGYKICGATINRSSTDYIGLFGYVGPGSAISCVGMVDANITGNNFTGGLAGYNNGSTITKSRTSGTVSGNAQVGGLVGANHGAVNCSYSMCNVTGVNRSGGLVGYNNGSVNTTYGAGFVSSSGATIGGLVGNNTGSVADSFWDNETSGQTGSNGGTGKNTSRMMNQSTFTGIGWNFTSIWDIDEGQSYPWLRTERIWWLIYDLDDLQNITKNLDGNYRLANDIDCTSSKSWNGGAGFLPIGNASSPFTGTLDGNEFEISGLWINRSSTDYIGLFGYTKAKGTIVNVVLESINVSGASHVGGLAGYSEGRTIHNCHVNGSVIATGNNAGGLIGYNHRCLVIGSSSNASVNGMNAAGGLIGRNDESSVEDSLGQGPISGAEYVGGLIGYNSDYIRSTRISNCSSSGPVSGENFTGGLVGYKYFSGDVGSYEYQYILDSHSSSDVACTGNYAGGLAGYLLDTDSGPTKILNSHATGDVSGKSYTGGLIGGADGEFYTTIITSRYEGPGPEGEGEYAGGLIGYADGINFEDCYSIVSGMDLRLKVDYVGGLAGYFNGGTIGNCWSTNTAMYLSGTQYVGGLVGYSSAIIESSFSTAGILGNDSLGGLVGWNEGDISNSYSSCPFYGIVGYDGFWGVGGLVGNNGAGSSITNCHSTSYVGVFSGGAGGLVGGNGGSVTDSFWDTETSTQSASAGGTGKTTEEMMRQSTFTNWDFTVAGDGTIGTWIMAGYPHLQFEHTETIENVIDLQLMAVDLTADYSLAKSVGCSGISAWNGGAGFSPVGNATQPFTGTFDGSGYSIINPFINRPTEDNIGLFGSTGADAVIANVTVGGLDVKGAENVGGLVGANRGTIHGCLVNGTVTGVLNVGGFVGSNDNGTISACTSRCTVAGVEASGEGLVGHWKMDEAFWNGTQDEVVDASGNDNNGTAHNGANTTAPGKFGRCGDFDGVDDYVHCGDDASLGPLSAITVEAWARFDSVSGSFPQIVARGDQTNGWNLYSYSGDNYEFSFIVLESGGSWGDAWALGTTIPQPDTWYHVVGTYDGSSVRIYVNGTLEGEDSTVSGAGIEYEGFTTTYIGRKGSGNYFNGTIDEVAVYNRSLALEEVRVLYEVTRNIGGLAGNNSGELTDCSATGPVTGNRSVGGLVGNNEDSGIVSKCYTSGDVGGENATGGLAGANYGLVNNCSSIGTITGVNTTGGLAGYNNGTVECCYSYGSIYGNIAVGGLVGHNDGCGTTRNSYSHCVVNGIDSIGGLIGRNDGPVTNCYSAGFVIGSSNTGGLIGLNTSTVTNCFWDNETSGHVTSDGGYGRNTTEMKQQSTFTGWDFANIWNIDEGKTYPFLRSWEDPNQVVPVIEITIEASVDFVNIGDTVHYYVNITNHGPSITNNLIATINLPTEVSYVTDNQSAGPPVGAALGWSIGTLAVGQTVYWDIQVTVISAGAGTINVSGSASIIGLVLNTTTETITANIPPLAADDLYTTDEDNAINIPAPGLLANDTDPDASGQMSVIDFDSTSSYGAAVTVNADGSFDYDPTASSTFQPLAVGEYLLDTFAYTIDDGKGATDTAFVTINVTGINDAPTAGDDSATTDEETVLSISAPGVLVNDVDLDTTDTLTVISFDATSTLGATITLNSDGSYEYNHTGIILFQTLAVGESVLDSFNYTVGDGNGGADNGTVTVTVNGLNDEPVITTSDLEEATENVSYVVDYEATEIDTSDTLTWDLVTNATWLSINQSSGVLNGTPNSTHIGSYWINITVSDGNGGIHSTNFSLEVYLDTDGDETPDVYDTDDDDDGVLDVDDDFPLDPTEDTDTDGDGIGNNADLDDDDDGTPDIEDDLPLDPTENTDTDGDGIGNNADTDDDGDDVPDVDDDFPLDPTEWVDTDGDDVGNNADIDDDGDGWNDTIENLAGTDPLDSTSVPTDTDDDGNPDALDDDDDDDGVLDANDDFPLNPNEHTDTDNDGIGNNADTDDDEDGLLDTDEDINSNGIVDEGETDPLNPDTDGDGYDDGVDYDPLNPDIWEEPAEKEEGIPIALILIPIIVVIIALLLVMMLLRKRKPEEALPAEEVPEEEEGAETEEELEEEEPYGMEEGEEEREEEVEEEEEEPEDGIEEGEPEEEFEEEEA